MTHTATVNSPEGCETNLAAPRLWARSEAPSPVKIDSSNQLQIKSWIALFVVRTADEFEAEEGVVLVSEGALEHDVVGARAQLVQAARDVRLR